MKKLCMISTVSITLDSFVVETAKHLHNECGYDVTLICDGDEAFAGRLPDYIHYIPVPMSRGINLSGFKSILSFRRIFKKERFDLIQYCTPNASFYASVAAKLTRSPIRLYCQWGIRYVGFAGGIKRKIFKALEKIVCSLSTHVFAVSPMNRQFAVDEGLYRESKAIVVGNGGTIGVDMTAYDVSKKTEWRSEVRARYGISEQALVLGFAGRICADKGCVELFKAFKNISESGADAKLLMVGPLEDNSGISAELVEWARASESVVLCGKVNNADMKEYYSAMDVLVHPTYREGFGMVIQEAGALSVPVITTRIPGASEVMVENESCLLVNAGDASDLERAMRSVCDDAELAEGLGKAAYDRTAELYERKIMLENQRLAYTKLLGE